MPARREDGIQRTVIQLKPFYQELDWLFHIPNGGVRSPKEAAIMSGLGVVPAVSDLFLPLPIPAGPAGLWLELKAPGETPTHEQSLFLADMQARGYEARWADDSGKAIEIVVDYVKRHRAAVARYGSWKWHASMAAAAAGGARA